MARRQTPSASCRRPAQGASFLCLLSALLCATPGQTQDQPSVSRSEAGELENRIARMERILESRTLIQMLNSIEQLRADLGALRGQLEVQGNDLARIHDRQRELFNDMDTRLYRLEQTGGGGGAADTRGGGAGAPGDASANAGDDALDTFEPGRPQEVADNTISLLDQQSTSAPVPIERVEHPLAVLERSPAPAAGGAPSDEVVSVIRREFSRAEPQPGPAPLPGAAAQPLPETNLLPDTAAANHQSTTDFGLPETNLLPDTAAQPLPGADTLPDAAAQPLPGADTLPDAAAQPLPGADTLPDAAAQPLPGADTLPDAAAQPLPGADTLPDAAAQPLPRADTLPDAAAQPLPGADTLPGAAAQPLPETSPLPDTTATRVELQPAPLLDAAAREEADQADAGGITVAVAPPAVVSPAPGPGAPPSAAPPDTIAVIGDNFPDPAAAAPEPAIDPLQIEAEYRRAFSLMRQRHYDRASSAFRSFTERFPDSEFADNAQYWLGESHYALAEFSEAIVEYEKIIENYPESSKLTHAMLKIAYSYQALKNNEEAQQRLYELIEKHPGTSASRLARDRLEQLGGN